MPPSFNVRTLPFKIYDQSFFNGIPFQTDLKRCLNDAYFQCVNHTYGRPTRPQMYEDGAVTDRD